jgi:hypothetical protein
MNEFTLEFAAVYVNNYRSKSEQLGEPVNKALLRQHITSKFGAVYAAILVA